MIIENITLVKLTADDKMYLTNGESYGKEIYLGNNDNENNWYQITEEEYQKILDAQKEEQEKNKNI